MESKKLKTITGYTALARCVAALGCSDHALDADVLREVPRNIPGYPRTPYEFGPTVAFWKGSDNRYFAWPEVSQRKYEIHELID